MSMDNRGARLSRRDVVDLAQASEQLAVVSGMIRSSGVKWAEVSVNLLIVANQTVVRIQQKGAGAFARYLEKQNPMPPALKAEIEKVDEELNQVRKTPPDEDVED
jgi:hypothetical protein